MPDKALRHRQRLLRIAVERTLADRRAAVADVQHRRKADVDILCDHFRRHQPAGLLRQTTAFLRIVQRGERLRRRQAGEALAEALYAPAL